MEVDDTLAQQWLANVSYYRLSAYWYPARAINSDGLREDNFIGDISFAHVAELYEADRKLRTLVHDGMERIEVAMRTRIGERLYATSPSAYTDPTRFRDTFKHAQWVDKANERIDRAIDNNDAIQHYESEYNRPYPFWILAEVLDFADISLLFKGLKIRDQRQIAEELNIVIDLDLLSENQRRKVKQQSPLTRWLHQFTIVRNACAHHGRLWNRSFIPAPTSALRTQAEFSSLPEGQSERLFGALIVMAHILRVVSPGTTWPAKGADLITDLFLPNPLVSPKALGLPENWNGSF